MRPAVLLLVFSVCKAPSPSPRPEPDRLVQWQGQLQETAARDARRGRFEASTRAYRRLADVSPTAPSRCQWQIAVVHNTLAAATKREQVEEIRRLAALDRTLGIDAFTPEDERQACHGALHDLLVEVVFVWNRELTGGCTAYSWQNWPLLEVLFHEFLADYPRDPRAPEARRQLERLLRLERGESLYDIERDMKR
jgi:hypothetical protein